MRLSESLVKMRLRSQVHAEDVREALRLFRTSTLAAASAGTPAGQLQSLGDEQRARIQNAENFLKQRVPIGANASSLRLIEEGVLLGHSDSSLRQAIIIMKHRSELAEFNKGLRVRRVR